MTIPARTTLTVAIVSLLEDITPDAGARTNIGRYVPVGAESVNATDLPCCALSPGQETPAPDAGPNGHVQIAYTVIGYLNRRDTQAAEHTADPDAEFALVDAIIADIRDAIEGPSGCVLSTESDGLLYQGATPLYHALGGEACGAELRYLITTPFIDYIPGQ